MPQTPRILVTPLDWGLGHATRCIPVIRELKTQGAEVVIGADNGPLAVLKEEFPNDEHVVIPGYPIHYPDGKNPSKIRFVSKLLLNYRAFKRSLKGETGDVAEIIDELGITGVISDNRFGCYSDRIPSVILSHQVNVMSPIMQELARKQNMELLRQFDQVWIPDHPSDKNLSGELSHPVPEEDFFRYIGPLSRFEKNGSSGDDLVLMVSGPEPQRNHFAKDLYRQACDLSSTSFTGKIHLVTGTPTQSNDRELRDTERVLVKSHASAKELNELLNRANHVICRAGYTSIMDLAKLGISATLVPTPGQTEQEYLAELHGERGHYAIQRQKGFDLETALEDKKRPRPLEDLFQSQLLKGAVEEFLVQC